MNLLKTFLFTSVGLVLTLSSCKKNEVEELKDFSYYQKNISSDRNIINMLTSLNEGINSLELSSSNSFTKISDFKALISREFTKEKMEKRARIATSYYGKFIADNPEFLKLSQVQKAELLKQALRGSENFEKTFFAIKTFTADCMGGFNHMANVCSDSYDWDVATAPLDPDPLMWFVNLYTAEQSYVGCLNDAADAMDVCNGGGYVH